jgi:hypothetical protein
LSASLKHLSGKRGSIYVHIKFFGTKTKKHKLFIYDLFNDTVNSSDYIASNDSTFLVGGGGANIYIKFHHSFSIKLFFNISQDKNKK